MRLECIKGYATNENLVFMEGDTVRVVDVEEGMIYLEGIFGWCSGTEMNFAPEVITTHFKYISMS
jgi:hypothetical protein